MKARTLILTAAFVAGFLAITSTGSWRMADLLAPLANTRLGAKLRGAIAPLETTGKLWTSPEVAQGANTYTADEQNNIDIYRMANEATVNITSVVYRQDWFFQVVPERGQGSGFLIDADGRILTNRHVVSGRAPEVWVTLADKTRYKARILGRDSRADLALIKIEPKKKLPFLKLGDSDKARVGQKVLAIGNPFGLDGTLTVGVVSAVGRTIRTEDAILENMIQTDAAINPGNSGGPLLDGHGNVLGINTMIYGAQGNIGIGFAMPINRAIAMLEEYQARGRVARPVLGITTYPVEGDLAEALELPVEGGLLIQEVAPGSPAEAAGLRGARRVVYAGNYPIGIGGDLIIALDGQPIRTQEAMQRLMNRKKAGDPLEVTIFRQGRTMKIRVTLGAAAEEL
jgi:S1-C subfamily serine protease